MPDGQWIRSRLPSWMDRFRYGVAVQDHQGVIVYVNRAAARIAGLSEERLLGSAVRDFVSAEHSALYADELQRRKRAEAAPYVLRFRLPNKGAMEMLLIPEVICDATGTVCGSIATVLELSTVSKPIQDRLAGGLEALIGEAKRSLQHIGAERTESRLARLRRKNDTLACLTPREWVVAQEIYRGHRVRNIVLDLEMSENTVRCHLKSIFRKLGVVSQSDLIDWLESLD